MLLLGKYRVYFPFADGVLGYNCRRCGYRCCQGAGFSATKSELVTLRRHYPELAYFTQVSKKADQPLVDLVNFRPQCFFLRGNGHCDVHARHGREAKPYVCKTFPINAFRLSGDVVVADVNFLCPLELWSERDADDARIHHEDLLRDIVDHAEVVVATATRGNPVELSHARVELEERLRDLSLALPLLDLCALFEAAAVAPDPLDAGAAAARRPGLDQFRAGVVGFLRAPQSCLHRDDSTDRLVAALAPRLRLLTPLQYSWLPEAEALALVGRVIAALTIYARLIRSLNDCPVSLGTLNGLFTQFGYLLYFLAHIDRVPHIDELEGDEWNVPMAAGVAADARRLLTFIYVDNDEAQLTLGQIFDRLDIADPMLRVQVLQSFPTAAMKTIRFAAG